MIELSEAERAALRDQFAMAALANITLRAQGRNHNATARVVWAIADAMIAEREPKRAAIRSALKASA